MRLFEDREMPGAESGAKIDFSKIDQLPYADFIAYLGKNANDPKLKAAISAGLEDGDKEDDVFTFSKEIGVAVRGCKPTQSEVVLSKSLSFPLPDGDKNRLTGLLSSNSQANKYTAGDPIVIFNDGKTNYVIDGHHRWSQVHAVNPDAYITSFVMTAKKSPAGSSIGTEILKAVQMSILKVVQDNSTPGGAKLPSAPGSDDPKQNLFSCSEGDLKKFVVDTVGPTFLEVVAEIKKIEPNAEAAADYIWKNVQDLRENSSPIPGATKRELMPQTDGGKNDVESKAVDALMANKWMDELKSGVVNHQTPYESKKWIKTFEQFRGDKK